MKSLYIHLDSGRLVKAFVQTINELDGSFELVSGMTVLNAKSILASIV